MALVKEYSNANPVCKLTFSVSNDAVKSAKEVALLGEFNGWTKNLLKKQKNGTYQTSIELETGKTYAFRYLVDGQYWFNDEAADAYVPTGVSNEENSVVVLESVAIEVPKAVAKKVVAPAPKAEKVVAAPKVVAPKVEKTPAKKAVAPKVEVAPAKKVAAKKEVAPKATKVVAKKK